MSNCPEHTFSYPDTVESWREWLESTRYADVGRDSWIDNGYRSLMAEGAYSHLTPCVVDVLFDIAIDRDVYGYQTYMALTLLGEVKTAEAIRLLDR